MQARIRMKAGIAQTRVKGMFNTSEEWIGEISLFFFSFISRLGESQEIRMSKSQGLAEYLKRVFFSLSAPLTPL